MNELDAIHLSDSHGLGSERNTLVPGVNVPAYTPGTDPNKWLATVKAIGMARLAPSSSGYSLYKPVTDAVGSLPGYSGLANTTIQKKSPEEQNAVITKLAEVIARSGGDGSSGADRYRSGNWLFGNDFSSLQSASLAEAAQAERNAQDLRNFQLQQQAQEFQRQLALRQANRADSNDAWTKSQNIESNRLALLDRLQNIGQSEFADRLEIARLTGQNADQSAYSTAGNAAVDALSAAYKALSPAQEAFNARVYQEVNAYNARLGDVPEDRKLAVVQQPDGTAKVVGGKNAKPTEVYQALSTSPEGIAFQKASNDLSAAQIAQAKVQYTPRTKITPPALPQFNVAPLISLLQQYGYTAPTRPAAAPTTTPARLVYDPSTGTYKLVR